MTVGGTKQGRESAAGFGLIRPFQRDRKADFAAGSGEALVRSAVGQIPGTMASSDFTQGEVRGAPTILSAPLCCKVAGPRDLRAVHARARA